jgi:beta-lactamase superfamily II metal-dependent hydrolase
MSPQDLPHFLILDVGHGNCTILIDDDGVIIIDAPKGITHLKVLDYYGRKHVKSLLVSHAHYDHVEGITVLLCEKRFHVEKVYVNKDPSKSEAEPPVRFWVRFEAALQDAEKRNLPKRLVTEVLPTRGSATPFVWPLTPEVSPNLSWGDVDVEVLLPAYRDEFFGKKGRDTEGRAQTSNTRSAVLRCCYKGSPRVLLAGDLDEVGLKHLVRDHPNPKADVLVFPHHGGRGQASDEAEFARLLCDAVEPKYVIFSMERGVYENPRREIVEGVHRSKAKPRIVCTQLSTHCHSDEQPAPADPGHLSHLPAKGRDKNACCGGTLRVDLVGDSGILEPSHEGHQRFVDRLPGSPLCRTGPAVHKGASPLRWVGSGKSLPLGGAAGS